MPRQARFVRAGRGVGGEHPWWRRVHDERKTGYSQCDGRSSVSSGRPGGPVAQLAWAALQWLGRRARPAPVLDRYGECPVDRAASGPGGLDPGDLGRQGLRQLAGQGRRRSGGPVFRRANGPATVVHDGGPVGPRLSPQQPGDGVADDGRTARVLPLRLGRPGGPRLRRQHRLVAEHRDRVRQHHLPVRLRRQSDGVRGCGVHPGPAARAGVARAARRRAVRFLPAGRRRGHRQNAVASRPRQRRPGRIARFVCDAHSIPQRGPDRDRSDRRRLRHRPRSADGRGIVALLLRDGPEGHALAADPLGRHGRRHGLRRAAARRQRPLRDSPRGGRRRPLAGPHRLDRSTG